MSNESEYYAAKLREDFNAEVEQIRASMNTQLDRLGSSIEGKIKQATRPRSVAAPKNPRAFGALKDFPDRTIVGAFVKKFHGRREFHYGIISPPDGTNRWSVTGRRELTQVTWGQVLDEMRRDEDDLVGVFASIRIHAFSEVDL